MTAIYGEHWTRAQSILDYHNSHNSITEKQRETLLDSALEIVTIAQTLISQGQRYQVRNPIQCLIGLYTKGEGNVTTYVKAFAMKNGGYDKAIEKLPPISEETVLVKFIAKYFEIEEERPPTPATFRAVSLPNIHPRGARQLHPLPPRVHAEAMRLARAAESVRTNQPRRPSSLHQRISPLNSHSHIADKQGFLPPIHKAS